MFFAALYYVTFALITVALLAAAAVTVWRRRATAHFFLASAGVAALMFGVSIGQVAGIGVAVLVTAAVGALTLRIP